MIELARLYQEVAELVQQQEPAVEQINQGAQDVVENVDNANKQIDSAIVSARNARRWKWYILIVVSTFSPAPVSSCAFELVSNVWQFSLSLLSSVSPLVSPKPTSTKQHATPNPFLLGLTKRAMTNILALLSFFSTIIPIVQSVQFQNSCFLPSRIHQPITIASPPGFPQL